MVSFESEVGSRKSEAFVPRSEARGEGVPACGVGGCAGGAGVVRLPGEVQA
jgi:hypothetical protein